MKAALIFLAAALSLVRPALAGCFEEDATHLVLERELVDFRDGHWVIAIIRQVQGKQDTKPNVYFIDGVKNNAVRCVQLSLWKAAA